MTGAADLRATVNFAVARLALGEPVVVVDDEGRENEGDLVVAGELMTPELMAFMIRYTSGFICAPMDAAELDRLDLPDMVRENQDRHRTAFAISVDARSGVTTGISAADRARTIRLLADPATTAGDLSRPGHILPLRARAGGVIERPGHTEASILLTKLAGLSPVAAIGELVNDEGSMMRGETLRSFAAKHGLATISVPQLVDHERRFAMSVPLSEASLQTQNGNFTAIAFAGTAGVEHMALVMGDVRDATDVLFRLHSECLTGDALGSLRCDCGQQLAQSMERIAAAGRGVILYMRGHEGRGIGLINKIRAYGLQDGGADTVDANLRLGLPVDARDYAAASGVLSYLGVRSVRLLSNNPDKTRQLLALGVEISSTESVETPVTIFNSRYLTTKRDRLGHRVSAVLDPPSAASM